MSFLVADGHVEVTAKTGDAERNIRNLETALSGLGPAAQAASNGLKDLRTRAAAGGAALGAMGRQAKDAEKALVKLKASAGDIRVSATLADETRTGVTAVKAALRDLKAESPVRLSARMDDDTTSSINRVRAAIRDLKAESPVRLSARLEAESTASVATMRAAIRELKAESPIRLAARVETEGTASVTSLRTAIRDLKAQSPIRLSTRLDTEGAARVAALRNAVRDLKAQSPIQLTARVADSTGSSLARVLASVRSLKAESPIRLRTEVDSDTTGIAATRQALRDLRAASPVRIRATFDGDGAAIVSTARAVGTLRDRAEATSRALTALATRSAAAAAALHAVKEAAQEAGRALRTLRGRAQAAADALGNLRTSSVAAAAALRSINTGARNANHRLGTLGDSTRTLRRDLDDLDGSLTRVGGSLGGLRGRLGSLGGSSDRVQGLTGALLSLATAAIPVAASLAPIVPLALSAGTAMGVLGVAAAGQIVHLAHASEAESKYQDAVKEHGRTSAEAAQASADYARVVEQMPAPTRQAAAAFSSLRGQYKSWSDALAGDTMPVFTRGLETLSGTLPKISPLARTASDGLQRLITIAAGGIESPGFDRLISKVDALAGTALRRATDGLLTFIRSAQTGSVGGGVSSFMDYARAHGPLAGETMRNLGQVLLKLLEAASDVGVGMLTVVNAFASLASSVPTGLISNLLQVYAAFKLIKLAAVGMTAVNAGVATMVTQITAMRTAAAGAATRMAGLRAAMAAIPAGGQLALAAAAAAVLTVGVSKLISKMDEAPPSAERLSRSMIAFARSGKISGEAARVFGKDLSGFGDAVARIAHPSVTERLKDVGHELVTLGFGTEASLDKAQKSTKSVDKALSDLVSKGHADIAAVGFERFAKAAGKGKTSTDKLRGMLPKYKEALANAKVEQQLVAQSMGLFGAQALKTKSKLDAQKTSADGLRQAIQALNDVNRSALGAEADFEQAIDDAAKAAKKGAGALHMHNGELDLNGQKARDNYRALQDLATKTDEAAGKAREQGQSWQKVSGVYERGRSKLLAYAKQMGLSSKEARQLVSQLLNIPSSKTMRMRMETEDAVRGLTSVVNAIRKTPDRKSITVKALSDGAVQALRDVGLRVTRLKDGSFKVTAKTGDVGNKLAAVTKLRNGLKDKSITLSAKAVSALKGLDSVIAKMKKTPGAKTITVKSLTGSAISALESVGIKTKRLKDGRIAVYAKTGGAQANIGAVQSARDRLASKSITLTVNRVTNVMTNYYSRKRTGATFGPNGSYWNNASGGLAPGFADGGSPRSIVQDAQMFPEGGFVRGPGTGRSDSIMAISMAGMPYRISNTEYVVQAKSVDKYGVRMLDAINQGTFELPRFASGGQAAKDARRQLTSDTTFTSAGSMARYKYVEVVHDLGMPDSVGSMVTSINTYLRNIKAAFSGSTESRLVSQLNRVGPALFDYQRQIEDVDKRMEDAKSSLENLKGEFDNLRSSVKGSLVAFGNITKIGKWGTSPQTLINQLQQDAGRTGQFASQLDQLKNMGLDPAILKDIAEAGLTGGGMATATSLLRASPEQIAEINRLQKQLTDSADAAGRTTADAMYGAGIRAGEGLVAGLEAQHDNIRTAMMNIAKSMEDSIKRALGIRSPAKRMEPIGDYAAQGVEVGWARRMGRGRTLISRAEPARISAPSSSALQPAQPAPAPAASPAPAAAPTVNLTVNVTTQDLAASPAERQRLANLLARETNEALRNYQRERAGVRR
ncbi:hypothetical protein [Streptomyces sp. NPDC006784]|uniref:hypothetical protein n=1 Tax=Streptomyces sp. NPDC006784 TaxID=3364764 RepID=UPI0036B4F565